MVLEFRERCPPLSKQFSIRSLRDNIYLVAHLPIIVRNQEMIYTDKDNRGKWFPGGSDGRELGHNVGDLGCTLGSGKTHCRRNCHPLQHSCLNYPFGQRCLVGLQSTGLTKSDMPE